jgi:hypothetical protein
MWVQGGEVSAGEILNFGCTVEQCYGANLGLILSDLFHFTRPLTSVVIGAVLGEY